MSESTAIETILNESRLFPPPADFAAAAEVSSFEEYEKLYARAEADPEVVLGRAGRRPSLVQKWDKVLEWNQPFAKWFVGGKINIAYNCLDRHLTTWRKNKAAIIWEGEPGEIKTITYLQLHQEVSPLRECAEKSRRETGDRVALYMPLVPALAVAMLACARIGATHTVIFGGFSADAIRDRVNDGQCKFIVTADGGYRRGIEIKLKDIVDEAAVNCPSVEHIVVFQRTGSKISMKPGRDHWWHELTKTVERRLPGRRTRFRTSALHSLHLRHDRKAERNSSHDRRLSDAGRIYDEARL